VEEDCVCYIFIMPSNRLNHFDTFCYVWGEQTLKCQRQNFTLNINKFYESYSECKVCYQDKDWAPHLCFSQDE
jgi:hypothetical protein